MKRYTYILLDWDGNIAQTLHIWPDAMGMALRKRGINMQKPELIRVCGGTVAYLGAHYQMSVAEAEAILHDATELVKEKLPHVELYPDAIDVLRQMKNDGKKMALITSSFHRVVEPLLIKFNMKELFDAVICSEDVSSVKPNPEPLHKALDQLGGNATEALMIGDSDKDINAGLNAGVDSVLFYPVEHQEIYSLEELMAHKPTYVVSGFWDVAKIANGGHAPEIY